ncbi:hypothetical protein HWV62_27797 [Athelia sp. TMB]|nr:hypothetical protein HWV62_41783 [Athelia sp. TMB]KAF7969273.1 hypothetical protein HWV62_27797 [Athelia sp. TMB]
MSKPSSSVHPAVTMIPFLAAVLFSGSELPEANVEDVVDAVAEPLRDTRIEGVERSVEVGEMDDVDGEEDVDELCVGEGVGEGVDVVDVIAIVDVRTDLEFVFVELRKFTEWFGIPITGEGAQNKAAKRMKACLLVPDAAAAIASRTSKSLDD